MHVKRPLPADPSPRRSRRREPARSGVSGREDYVAAMATTENHASHEEAPRELRLALLRGWRRRCPACGEGAMMEGYLTVRAACPACGTELHHHRADDGPAWATIMITGHIMAPLMLTIYVALRPAAWQMALGFSVFFVLLSLWLLPRLKGMFVGVQWAKRMHGFGARPDVARA
jgi:uncharacterized protein (DUF983 family)